MSEPGPTSEVQPVVDLTNEKLPEPKLSKPAEHKHKREDTRTWLAQALVLLLFLIVVAAFLLTAFGIEREKCMTTAQWAASVSKGEAAPGRIFIPSPDGGVMVAPSSTKDNDSADTGTQGANTAKASIAPAPNDIICRPTSPTAEDLTKLLTIVFGPIITLIGTVMGFYFGGKD